MTWLLLAPILMAGAAYLGIRSGPVLAGIDPTVRLALQVWQEEQALTQGTAHSDMHSETEASSVFRSTGKPVDPLYQEALARQARFRIGGGLVGGFLGLVIGAKGIVAALRRRRSEYEADQAACLACGRCYTYCPREHVRRNKTQEALG